MSGSHGEHALQQQYGTKKRAENFYDRQVLDYLNRSMREFIEQQEMVFIATADANGECDCSFRAGLAGFVRVLDQPGPHQASLTTQWYASRLSLFLERMLL